MRYAADTSSVLRLYLPSPESPVLCRFLADNDKTVYLSPLARIEVLNVLLRDQVPGSVERFEADLAEGNRLRIESINWPSAFQRSESLARRFSKTLRPSGHDLVLVAAATTMGATWFLSFDRHSRQRPLAAAAGLRVWPTLDREERGLARHAGQSV